MEQRRQKKLWKEKSFDLILLDGNLPDGDGFAVSREIRKESKVPIVFLTARDMDEDMIEALKTGRMITLQNHLISKLSYSGLKQS